MKGPPIAVWGCERNGLPQARRSRVAAGKFGGYTARAAACRRVPPRAPLRRYSVSPAGLKHSGEWSAPALANLRYDPDPISATAIRRADPDWALRVSKTALRDEVTHTVIPAEETTAR
jgi:nicotinate-nucleotide adenylyltransferase